MPFRLFILCLLLSLTSLSAAEWRSEYDRLLQNYVTSSGVKYREWHRSSEDRGALTEVVRQIGIENPKTLSKQGQLAFYLNAYNAWILHRIIDSYPTKGPGGGGFIGRTRFFRSKSIRVAGERMSFHILENDIIRTRFSEPRIHFALNCASRSCPPLHGRAFEESTLETVLDKLTTAFINRNPLGIRKSRPNEIKISEIFKWYATDFEGAGSVLSYINRYRTPPFPSRTKIRYQDYQWTLNESP